jgi:hypothetical protein
MPFLLRDTVRSRILLEKRHCENDDMHFSKLNAHRSFRWREDRREGLAILYLENVSSNTYKGMNGKGKVWCKTFFYRIQDHLISPESSALWSRNWLSSVTSDKEVRRDLAERLPVKNITCVYLKTASAHQSCNSFLLILPTFVYARRWPICSFIGGMC